MALILAVLAGAPPAVRSADDVPLPAGTPGVSLRTDVFEVERVLDVGGRVERRLVPAQALVAGDELRYAIVLRNETGTRFDAGRVQVQTAVPAATQFLPGSAGGPGTLVEYALADGDFSENLPELTDVDEAQPELISVDEDRPGAAERPESAELAAPDTVVAIPNEPASGASASQEAAEPEGAAASEDASLLTIRWTYQRPLEPGAEAELFFHVRLD
jgi:uncharacterized repeat protein (TIGR01451 family)